MAINQQTNPQTATGMQIYAAAFIEALTNRLIEIDGFARNFTADFRQPGDTLNVPYVEGNTSSEFDAEDNNFCTATTDSLKNVVVKLGSHPIVKFTVTPDMVAAFTPNYWEEKARLNANELADSILKAVAALPVGSKVTNSIQLAKDTCTYEDVIDIAAKADSLNIRTREATLYLANADYHRLLKSLTYSQTGGTSITQGDIGVDFGFRRVVCLPPQITGGGFVGTANLVAIASKPYLGEQQGARGDILVERLLTEPNTGLTVVETLVSNPCTKSTVHNLDCWYGAEIANPKAGLKITHAAA